MSSKASHALRVLCRSSSSPSFTGPSRITYPRSLPLPVHRYYSFSTDHLDNPPTTVRPTDEESPIARRAELLRKVLELRANARNGKREQDGELKCQIYDLHGRLNKGKKSLTKSYICEHYEIHPRDLRKLDSNSTVIPGDYTSRFTLDACVLPRKKAIVVNLLYVKALISHDHIIVFDPPTDSTQSAPGSNPTSQSPASQSHAADLHGQESVVQKPMAPDELHALFGNALVEHLAKGQGYGVVLNRTEEAFEHRALESLLLTLLAIFTSELSIFLARIRLLLHDLSEDISRDELKRLLTLKTAVGGFEMRVKGVNDGVERVLSDDDELGAGYLTSKALNKQRLPEDHEELELLLENYSQHLEGIMSEVAGALSDVQSTQNVVELLLDSSRNMLLVLDLRISIATLGMSTGALGAGLLGMNLANGFEDSQAGFYIVGGALLTISLAVVSIGWRILSRWSKVGLAGVKGMRLRNGVSKRKVEINRLLKDE